MLSYAVCNLNKLNIHIQTEGLLFAYSSIYSFIWGWSGIN